MQLFKIFGSVAVKNEEAKQALNETSSKAKSTARDIDSANKSTQSSNKSTGSTFSSLKSKVAEYKAQGMSTSQAWRKANQDMKRSSEESSNGTVGAFKKIGLAVGTFLAVDKIIGFGKSCVESAATVKAQTAQFEAAFGELQGDAHETFNSISDDTGVLATRLEVEGTKGFSQFKGAGLSATEALKETDRFTRLAADGAAYYDMSLEETSELMRSFIRGNTEAGDRIGLFTSETQRNQAALDKLGKKYIECTESEKQMIMLDIANEIYKSSGAMGQASREADGYENVVGNLKESFRQFMAALGSPVLALTVPILQKMAGAFSTMTEKVKSATTYLSEHKTAVIAIGAVLGTLIFTIGAYNLSLHATAIASAIATTATGGLAAVIGFLTSPVTIAIAAITALIAIGVALYKNWDKIKAQAKKLGASIKKEWEALKKKTSDTWNKIKTAIVKPFSDAKRSLIRTVNELKASLTRVWDAIKSLTSNVWNKVKYYITHPMEAAKAVIRTYVNTIKSIITTSWNAIRSVTSSIWNSIKSAVTRPINAAKDAVQTAINKIKSIMHFKWSLPHLKLPHISITGEFGIKPPRAPKFGIEWYSQGGIMNRPTAFGMNGDNLMVGGEAGPEAIAPISDLMKYVRTAVAEENNGLANRLDRLISLISTILDLLTGGRSTQVVLESGAVVGELVEEFDRALGDLKSRKERGF